MSTKPGQLHVRRQPQPGQRRYLGRLERIERDAVVVSEAYDQSRIVLNDAKLEGSKANFACCLRGLLRNGARSFNTALDQAQAAYQLGPDFDSKVDEVGKYLAHKPIPLTLDLQAQLGQRLKIANDERANSIYKAPAVDYVYDRASDRGVGRRGQAGQLYNVSDTTATSGRDEVALELEPGADRLRTRARRTRHRAALLRGSRCP